MGESGSLKSQFKLREILLLATIEFIHSYARSYEELTVEVRSQMSGYFAG